MFKFCVFLGVLVSVASCAAQSLPVQLPYTVSSTNGACSSAMTREAIHLSIRAQVSSLLRDEVVPALDNRPPCACGGPGEWTRIAHLNMSDPSQQCPTNWSLFTTPVRGCGRQTTPRGCDSVTFSSSSRTYSHVCGRINAYQRGSTDAFYAAIRSSFGLEQAYLDGVSLTHGAAGSRQHIWSFAAAYYENDPDANTQFYVCRCSINTLSWPYQLPSFVGSNYFCDTGNPGVEGDVTTIYGGDPLWDGEGCGPTNDCCEFNNPPWFCTMLQRPTTDDLEVRLCHDEAIGNEDTLVSLIDIYVK